MAKIAYMVKLVCDSCQKEFEKWMPARTIKEPKIKFYCSTCCREKGLCSTCQEPNLFHLH